MLNEYLKLALGNIRKQGIRAILTLLGIIIGISTVFALISIGLGFQEAMNKQFESMGTNTMIITPGGSLISIGSSSAELTDHDLDLIRGVNGIKIAAPIITRIVKVSYNDEIKYTWLMGIATDDSQDLFWNMQQFKIEDGQDRFKQGDTFKVGIGYRLSHADFFSKEVEVGDKIKIYDYDFKVAATLSQIGNPSDDSQIYIPLETAKKIFDTDEYMMVFANVKEGQDIEEVAEDIKKEMRDDRNLKKGEEDFSITTSKSLMDSFNSILSIVSLFLIGIASISLVVGGVGIMNTTYTSVMERTNEIGIMKALGAQNSTIMSIFLIESGILGLIGGLIGCLIGFGLAKIVEFVALSQGVSYFAPWISIELIAGVLIFSTTIGAIAGLFPAKNAAQLKPVDALRYE